MNNVRSDFPPNLKKFFYNLQEYLDEELYFYGSVNRSDYVHGKSDIDVAIFTDNEYSVISKLQHFLHVKREAFDKIIWKLYGKIIYGYKIKCDKYVDSKCEIVIYNNDFKNILMEEMQASNKIPLFISILIYILKTFYYTIPILNEKIYSACKRYIFNELYLQKTDSIFFLLHSDTNTSK
jgi:predicted nucleotidyltransferase